MNKQAIITIPYTLFPLPLGPDLFTFFDGLIPEGWLLDVALRKTDISVLDRMSLLLLCYMKTKAIVANAFSYMCIQVPL